MKISDINHKGEFHICQNARKKIDENHEGKHTANAL